MIKANTAKCYLNVLVARPEDKGQALVRDLAKRNIATEHCALFRYQLVDDVEHCRHQLLTSSNNILVFVSPNAVKFAAQLLNTHQWCFQHVIAIGQATKEALAEFNIQAVSPQIETSEGLLSLKILQEKHVKNKRVVIVRGDKGRELIFNTLIDRKANISYAKSYQRQWHDIDQETQLEHWLHQQINCIVVTSVAILEAMLNLFTLKQTTYWIVPSERVAQRAKVLGITHIINAKSANNQHLINTIIDLNNLLLEKNNDR